MEIRAIPGGGIRKRYTDQVCPRYPEDDEPGDEYSFTAFPDRSDDIPDNSVSIHSNQQPEIPSSVLSPPQSPAYGRGNPRRSKRTRMLREMFDVVVTDCINFFPVSFLCWRGAMYNVFQSLCFRVHSQST